MKEVAYRTNNLFLSNLFRFNNYFNVSTGCCGGPNEKRLLSNLLDKYNTLERPVFNESEPVVVSFGLTLMQIIDVVWINYSKMSLVNYRSLPVPRFSLPANLL